MKTVYALHVDLENESDAVLKIERNKHWQNQLSYFESYQSGQVLRWNMHYYLSTSRAALKEKAKQIVDQEIEKLQSKIEVLEDIREGIK